MYSMDDILLINQLNEYAARRGLPPIAGGQTASTIGASGQYNFGNRVNPAAPTGYSAGRPGLTSLPDGPSSQLAAYGGRAQRGAQAAVKNAGNLKQITRAIDPSGVIPSTAKDSAWLMKKMGLAPKYAAKAGRLAGAAVPVLSVIANAQDVGQILTGDESLANKAMDATAMTAGAAIGGVLGGGIFSPLTASIGASTGKMLSDGTQWLFGDKKTPEQRKMELALAQLQGRGMY
tara:strand:- start:1764 stop:2462 length:699 start_codon:yes stop_codon:yes gene_type:complete